MKKFLIFSLALLISISGIVGIALMQKVEPCLQQVSAQSDNPSSIVVIGEAKQEVAPDKAIVSANIERVSSELGTAKDEVTEIFDKAINYLTSIGINKEDIVTEYFSVYPRCDYHCSTNSYTANTAFSFKIDDLSQVDNTIDELFLQGITSINNISYQVSNQAELYEQTMLAALDNAKSKAANISGKDIENLELVAINEEYIYSSTNLYRNYADGSVENDMVGKIIIAAKLKVEFAVV